ncbi:MAG: SUMF1/EgtB/PvdO family nonheme iron enzyme [Candidatus Saganbacteria bacterium]|nr:SUMF1/EgtB/PvdO family nonheme iron enzyme [Candidatus Saganbacteria bacterium]
MTNSIRGIMSGWTSGGKPVSSRDFRAALSGADRIMRGNKVVLSRIEIPAFVKITEKSFRIMKDELTIGQFGQFVSSAEYEIAGQNARSLKQTLAGTDQSITATYISLNDGLAYAEWLSEMTGRSFRLPTEKEWLYAAAKVRCQLSGRNWEWTKTPISRKLFFLRRLTLECHSFNLAGLRFKSHAVRLLEDLNR